MESSSGHGRPDSTMTPPATPTSPRFTTLPIRTPHVTSPAAHHVDTLSSSSQSLNGAPPECDAATPCASTADMSPPSASVYVSPDGVWENPTPYAIMHEAPLGVGLWSSVYLASPTAPDRHSPTWSSQPIDTPPATPIRRRGQSNSVSSTDSYMTQLSLPSTYTTRITDCSASSIWAIKAPADKAAFGVIRSEARVLTNILRCTTATPYTVPFLGLDPRSGGLLMQAQPLALEDFIRGDLASIPEKQRTNLITSLFPTLATKLLTGLEWLHEEAGVVHADIKPSNILLRPLRPGLTEAMLHQRLRSVKSLSEGGPLDRPSLLLHRRNSSIDDDDDDLHVVDFEPLYTDFSAAISLRPFLPPPPPSPFSPAASSPPLSPVAMTSSVPAAMTTAPPPHLAGGTWDFLAPELCRLHPAPPEPSPASDVYALGVTFLVLVLGQSPFDALAGGNAFRKREMVKMGDAVGFAAGERGFRAVKAGFAKTWPAFEGWLRKGLMKKVEMRTGGREWRMEVEGLVVG